MGEEEGGACEQRSSFGNRYRGPDFRSTITRFDFQAAAELLYPFAHSSHADPRRTIRTLSNQRSRRRSAAVVLNFKHDRRALVVEPDSGRLAARVASDVLDALLEDAKQRSFDILGEARSLAWEFEVQFDSRDPFDLRRVRFDGAD